MHSVQKMMEMAQQLKLEQARMRASVTSEFGSFKKDTATSTTQVMTAVQKQQSAISDAAVKVGALERRELALGATIEEMQEDHDAALKAQLAEAEKLREQLLREESATEAAAGRADLAEAASGETGVKLAFAESALQKQEKIAEEQRKDAASQLEVLQCAGECMQCARECMQCARECMQCAGQCMRVC